MNDSQGEPILRILIRISESPRLSQRQLASQTGLSVGLVNLILKRLVHTGHIKIANLNKKKVEYLLTPKGFWEKARRSSAYVSKTVRVFLEYKNRLSRLVTDLIAKGHARFAILGQGETTELLEIVLRTVPQNVQYRFAKEGEPLQVGEMLLDCRLNGGTSTSYGVSILSKLLEKAEPPLSSR